MVSLYTFGKDVDLNMKNPIFLDGILIAAISAVTRLNLPKTIPRTAGALAKKVVAADCRRERACKRTGAPRVLFCDKGGSKAAGGWLIFDKK